MSDIQIFRKISPFIIRRVGYAILGLALILAILWLGTYWGLQYPEYRIAIITLLATVGVFVGWKIIRGGEKHYRLAQIALITNCVTGEKLSIENSRAARKKVKETFKYASVISLVKNVVRHKNLYKVPQYLMIMLTNLLPYSGTCTIAWIFDHPEEERLSSTCHAITNFHSNRKQLGKKIAWAVMKELILVAVLFFLLMGIMLAAYAAAEKFITNFEDILAYFDDFDDTLDVVMGLYFNEGEISHWAIQDVMVIVALYVAWFIKVFTVRAYQMIGIIRTYLEVGEENPPSDDLYNRIATAWEKRAKKKAEKSEAKE